MFKIKEIKKEKVVKEIKNVENFMQIKKGDKIKLGGEIVTVEDVKSF